MALQLPPTRYNGHPNLTTLPPGSELARVHPVAFLGDSFNPHVANVRFGGSRFDSTEFDPYGFLYAGDQDRVALAETFLRDIPANDRGGRFLSKPLWRDRQISTLTTTMELALVSLVSAIDLFAIGADQQLTACDADFYPQTRAWAQWLREEVPHACGLVWISKREPAGRAYVFFEDRCPAGSLALSPRAVGPDPCRFDDDAGFDWLGDALLQYRVRIKR